jgi:RNA polymerase sigma-70 factor (ECF subfamily)
MRSEERTSLREQIRDDPARFGEFVQGCRDRLLKMVEIRMDPRLRGRLDASDVVQDACAEAVQRLPDWLDGEEMPLHLWLRFLTGQKLLQLHRHHLGAEMRDPGREISLERAMPDASAVTLASAIADSGVLTPSGVALQAERAERLRAALESMKSEDREVLVLRHFEQLSNGDVARVLGLSQPGASLRYLRAAKRLREILAELSGSAAG